jgi:gluconolactonase
MIARLSVVVFGAAVALGCSSLGSEELPTELVVDPLANPGPLVLLAEGLGFGEGPLWFDDSEQLLFCEFKSDRIASFDAEAGLGVVREPAGGPAGLARAPGGGLVTAELLSRRVTHSDGDGNLTVIADSWQGGRLNGPNDLVFARDGSLYFTDPQLPYVSEFDLAFSGVFRMAPDGEMTLVHDGLLIPNGIALSPDERRLYVVGTVPAEVIAIDLVDGHPQGMPQTLIAEAGLLPDGMTVDEHGNLYVAENEGLRVFAPDGTLRGVIATPTPATNCAFGGADRSTLFILTEEALYAIDLEVRGLARG